MGAARPLSAALADHLRGVGGGGVGGGGERIGAHADKINADDGGSEASPGAVNATAAGGLRRLTLANYLRLPVRAVACILAALPSLAEVELRVSAMLGRPNASWRIDAQHLRCQIDAWIGHRMGEMTMEDARRWSESGPSPLAVSSSLLDF